MSRVFWDTNLFVYLIEGTGARAESVVALRRRMIERGDELLTSTLTLGELLVKPVEMGDDELRDRYVRAMDVGVTHSGSQRFVATDRSGRPTPFN